jgi:hypothetical protein
MMTNILKRIGFPVVIDIALISLMLSGCGGFGGHYKIESSPMEGISADTKIPVNVRLVLSSELCNYTYTSIRQGAKRVYDLGDAFCINNKNLFAKIFKNLIVVSSHDEDQSSDFDAIAIPRVIDTSVLVRPGAPPNFEATIIYECSIVDKSNRTIFLRTVKEDKIYRGYGYDSNRIVMQQAMDELFTQLGNELVSSPEIKKFANSIK